jgi:hypothetical protein
MSTLASIAFDPAKVTTVPMGCPVSLTSLVESTGTLTGFSSLTTFYFFAVSAGVGSLTVQSAISSPSGGTITVNGAPMSTSVALSVLAVNQVLKKKLKKIKKN